MLNFDKSLVFSSWIVVEPAEGIPGEWVAHCLDFDLISQGRSATEAVEAVAEAISMTIVDDVVNDYDPKQRRAPQEYWDVLAHVLKHGKQMTLSDAAPPAGQKIRLVTQVSFVLEKHVVVPAQELSPRKSGPIVVPTPTVEPYQVPSIAPPVGLCAAG